MDTAMTVAELRDFLAREFPQSPVAIDTVARHQASVRQRIGPAQLRPGGTVSGPTMMALADTAAYVAILAMIGPVALAVTTNLSITFLRKPAANADLIADARLLKLGRRLAVAEIGLHSEGDESLVAHATVTYSIPPR